jgi:hypothetical protein
MNPLIRGLTWPIISLLIVGGSHFIAEVARPELAAFVTPAVLMPLHLVAGAWAGHRTVEVGGTFVHGIVAGAILGLLPVALNLVGFGAILGRDPATVTTTAIFGFFTILWGGILGAGYAADRGARTV